MKKCIATATDVRNVSIGLTTSLINDVISQGLAAP